MIDIFEQAMQRNGQAARSWLARLQRYALAVWCWRARSRIACSPTKYAKPQWASRCRSDSGRAKRLPQLKAGTPLEVFAYDRANDKMLAIGRVAAMTARSIPPPVP